MYEIRIGPVLKRLMKERDLKLADVQRETGIAYSTLYTWQENRAPKKLALVQKLADFFGISLSELLFDLPRKKHSPQEPITTDLYRISEGEYHVTVRKIK